MRLPEQRLWDKVRRSLNDRGLFSRRVENLVDEGMPDLLVQSECMGHWVIELKAVEHAPVRDRTPLLGEQKGLSVAQKNWLMDYSAADGQSLIVLGVGSSLVFAIGGWAYDFANKLTYAEWNEEAITRSPANLAAYLAGDYRQ